MATSLCPCSVPTSPAAASAAPCAPHSSRSSFLPALVALSLFACGSPTPAPVTATAATPVAASTPSVTALPVPPPQNAPFRGGNPFTQGTFYRDPHYAEKVAGSAAKAPELAAALAVVKQQPTALWLDQIAALANVPTWLEDAERQGKSAGKPAVPVFVVYDLPNRDCAALASNGELNLDNDGERRYREEYIDVLAARFAEHPDLPIVAIIEPDSLPNLISNLGVEKCRVSQEVYINSVAYAVSKLSAPNVALYLDAAHAGWLGWEANQRRMAKLVKQVVELAGGTDRIRGLATNVANYNALRGDWGKRLEASNPSPNELSYVERFAQTLDAEGLPGMSFVVDTSRNGQEGTRTRWGNWCNIKGAGLGERPRVAPEARVDAYFWVKPPGDSDGTSDPNAARFDKNCASPDATPNAPEAGQWFESYFLDLVRNANPRL